MKIHYAIEIFYIISKIFETYFKYNPSHLEYIPDMLGNILNIFKIYGENVLNIFHHIRIYSRYLGKYCEYILNIFGMFFNIFKYIPNIFELFSTFHFNTKITLILK